MSRNICFELPTPFESLDEAKTAMRGQFGAYLHSMPTLHMVPLTMGRDSNVSKERLQNGTCFFWRTPSRLFAVTARHVIDAFMARKQIDANTKFRLGTIEIDPEARLISLSERMDLAIFEVTDRELDVLGKFPITQWPPMTPDFDGAPILFAGFVAAGTVVDAPNKIGFGIFAATSFAQRVTDRQLLSTTEWDFVVPSSLAPLPPRKANIGGASGGPVFLIKNEALLTLPVAGVISEGRSDTDTMVAERADFIRSNGTIRSG